MDGKIEGITHLCNDLFSIKTCDKNFNEKLMIIRPENSWSQDHEPLTLMTTLIGLGSLEKFDFSALEANSGNRREFIYDLVDTRTRFNLLHVI